MASCPLNTLFDASGCGLGLALHFLKLGTKGLLIFTGYVLWSFWSFFFTRKEFIKEDRRRRDGLSG
jgi:uncharacterized membrane protein YesL